MSQIKKSVIGIVGSYRKGGITAQAVGHVLDAAQERGAETRTIYLLEKNIGFCTNCRSCTQAPGPERGQCLQSDDMTGVLDEIAGADVVVLGAPVNFFNVNALTRRFIERLLPFAYWPWEPPSGPKLRRKSLDKTAVLVTATAMPAIFVRFLTGAVRALKIAAKTMGAKPVSTLIIGPVVANRPLPEKFIQKARRIGTRI